MKSFTKLFESMLTKPAVPTWGTATQTPSSAHSAGGPLAGWAWGGSPEQGWAWGGSPQV